MRILHTADWHLGKRLERFERREEQIAVLEEIVAIADREKVDAVVIAGDLFDTFNPPNASVEDFYRCLKRLAKDGKRPVVAIAGNHDSPARIEVPEPLARECGILLIGFPDAQIQPYSLPDGMAVNRSAPGFLELRLTNTDIPLRLLTTPYANEIRLRQALHSEAEINNVLQQHWQTLADQYCDAEGVNMLVAHLFMMKRGGTAPEEPRDEKPIHIGTATAIHTDIIPEQIQYAALGHLHRHQNISGGPCPVVYSSSLLEYSFAETGQEKFVVIVEAEPGKAVEYRKIALPQPRPLQRKRFSSVDEAVAWLNENQECYVELTIETEHYLSAEERHLLSQTHSRIIGPIPYFVGEAARNHTDGPTIDLQKSRIDLFRDYFEASQQQTPSDSIIDLFKEILQQDSAQ